MSKVESLLGIIEEQVVAEETGGMRNEHWALARELEESGIFKMILDVARDAWGLSEPSQVKVDPTYHHVRYSRQRPRIILSHVQEIDALYIPLLRLHISPDQETVTTDSPLVSIEYERADEKEIGKLKITGYLETYFDKFPENTEERLRVGSALEKAFARPGSPGTFVTRRGSIVIRMH